MRIWDTLAQSLETALISSKKYDCQVFWASPIFFPVALGNQNGIRNSLGLKVSNWDNKRLTDLSSLLFSYCSYNIDQFGTACVCVCVCVYMFIILFHLGISDPRDRTNSWKLFWLFSVIFVKGKELIC